MLASNAVLRSVDLERVRVCFRLPAARLYRCMTQLREVLATTSPTEEIAAADFRAGTDRPALRLGLRMMAQRPGRDPHRWLSNPRSGGRQI